MFRDRLQAAEELARALSAHAGEDGVVLAIPRGGVVVGAVLARELGMPLDVLLTKKIGHPRDPEFAIGSVDLDGACLDEDVAARESVSRDWAEREAARIRAGLRARYRAYRGLRQPARLDGKLAIVADDGIATGNTIAAALRIARREGARRVVAAAPVGSAAALARLSALADEIVCLERPEDFRAIGAFYRNFDPVEDDEVRRLLERGAQPSERLRS
ncbi:MAG TPA: phosphoribosyltransferase family protein [Elusimicrobiota bacterium]|nr:phosphoribosyltransferase family protein [Elusimicrobiota bacterium]